MKRNTPLKRKTPLRASYKPRQGRKLHVLGHSTSAQLKREIQGLVRDIVIKRDGGCIFRDLDKFSFDVLGVKFPLTMPAFEIPPCNGYANDGHLILQADHLITRANSATYADTRLIVCVCKGHHGWKSIAGNRWKSRYDAVVKTLIGEERVKLWERMEADRTPHHMGIGDWKLVLVALRAEYEKL